MLPELKAIKQPASIITTTVPFKEYNKIVLNQQGKERKIQLTQKLFSTNSISQFAFRELDVAAPPKEDEPENFESIWDND